MLCILADRCAMFRSLLGKTEIPEMDPESRLMEEGVCLVPTNS